MMPWNVIKGVPKKVMYTLNSEISTSLMSLLLLYADPRGNGCSLFEISLFKLSHFPHVYHGVLKLKETIKEFKPHACMHHAVIIVIIEMLMLSHVALILFYYAFMFTL
jgi:hypothetical protein